MKVGTLIIMTSAILALTASAASANLERVLPAKPTVAAHHKVLTHKKAVTHKVAKKQSTGPLYIYLPGPSTPPVPYVGDCLTSGNNCTDQELCDIWGMNCDLITTTPAPVAAPAESAPDASSTSTDAATASSSVDTSTDDNTLATDTNSVLCPSGTVWDEDHQYCA
jgi:hypothetical protein